MESHRWGAIKAVEEPEGDGEGSVEESDEEKLEPPNRLGRHALVGSTSRTASRQRLLLVTSCSIQDICTSWVSRKSEPPSFPWRPDRTQDQEGKDPGCCRSCERGREWRLWILTPEQA